MDGSTGELVCIRGYFNVHTYANDAKYSNPTRLRERSLPMGCGGSKDVHGQRPPIMEVHQYGMAATGGGSGHSSPVEERLPVVARSSLDKLMHRTTTADALASDIAFATTAPAPLCVRAVCGLCNQLRMVISYRAYAQRFHRPLILHWQRSDECPGRFDDLFAPIEGCLVIHSMSELQSLRPESDLGRQTPWAQPTRDIWGRDVYNVPEMWAVLRPHADVVAAVEERLVALGGAGCFIACHVRRTDHVCPEGTRSSDQSCYDFIDGQSRGAHGSNLAVFVATDNRQTQQSFLERYGTRVRGLTSINRNADGKLRHTTLFDAVVDIFTCVHASTFKGSNGSTFSDVIAVLRQCKGLASDADQHAVDEYKSTEFAARPSDARFWRMAHEDPLDPAVVEWLHTRSVASEDRLVRQATARAMAMHK